VQLEVGAIDNTKPFYELFRNCIISDLRISDRVSVSGLDHLLCNVVKHCFAGEPC
jgi:hypothetical protein